MAPKIMFAISVVIIGILHPPMVSTHTDLESACESKFENIDTIGEMLKIVTELRSVQSKWSSRDKSSYKMQRCIDEYDSIDELGELLSYHGDVCHPDHVDKVVKYHTRFIDVSSIEGVKHPFSKNKKMTRRFFQRYAIETVMTCRSLVHDNLRHAQMDFYAEDWSKVTGWKKSDNSTDSGERQMRHMIIKIIESIESFDDLINLMASEVDVTPSFEDTSIQGKGNKLLDEIGISVTFQKSISGATEVCNKFARYYESQIMSIVRLGIIGYKLQESKFNSAILKMQHRTSRYRDPEKLYNRYMGDTGQFEKHDYTLKRWLRVSLVCYSLRKYSSLTTGIVQSNSYISFPPNQLASTYPLINQDFVKTYAVSHLYFVMTELTRKFFGFINDTMNIIGKKMGPKVSKALKKYSLHTNMPSKVHEPLSRLQKDTIIVVSIFVFLGLVLGFFGWGIFVLAHG